MNRQILRAKNPRLQSKSPGKATPKVEEGPKESASINIQDESIQMFKHQPVSEKEQTSSQQIVQSFEIVKDASIAPPEEVDKMSREIRG